MSKTMQHFGDSTFTILTRRCDPGGPVTSSVFSTCTTASAPSGSGAPAYRYHLQVGRICHDGEAVAGHHRQGARGPTCGDVSHFSLAEASWS